jgi:5-(carboxyamino)imidazole ribonucleotide synthase
VAHFPAVGMVGGGQLARMTCQAAIGLGVGFRVLAGSPGESAAQVAAGTRFGDYRSLDDLRKFAAECDVLTFDHEHVPGGHLAELERAGVQVRPCGSALRFTQDKLAMRERLTGLGVPCPRFAPVRGIADVADFAAGTWPVMLKAVSGGYDGKGVWVCGSAEEAAAVFGHGTPLAEEGGLMAEEYVEFSRELAVLAARSPHRQGAVYPVVQTVQRDGICREVIAPAPGLPPGVAARAQALALRIAEELGVTGLLAVEMFEVEGAGGSGASGGRPRSWPTCSAATMMTSTTGTPT